MKLPSYDLITSQRPDLKVRISLVIRGGVGWVGSNSYSIASGFPLAVILHIITALVPAVSVVAQLAAPRAGN